MTTPSITVERVSAGDLADVERLLDADELPHEDLHSGDGRFFVATTGTEIVGAGGIEVHGSNGLVRSLVVAEPYRGDGYGTALYDALEEHAHSNGVDGLYLLTTTASGFFADRGYRAVDRETVPTVIRETPQFTDLCPASATCMAKHLR